MAARARILAAIGAALTASALAGCSTTLSALPAPNTVGGPVYRLTASFTDVGNLTEGANVKLKGVVVGEVQSITTKNFVAIVHMDVQKKFPLVQGTTFQVRFTTPLGDDFIAATPPTTAGAPPLADGADIPLSRTGEAPNIEDTFAAVSTLLNGGGLDKVRTIVTEVNTALNGHTRSLRDTVTQLRLVVAHLDAHKGDIDSALDGLNALTAKLNASTPLIDQALATFPQTLQAVASDTTNLRVLLTRVSALGATVKGLLDRSQTSLLTDLDKLRPTLDALAASDSRLVPDFTSLIAFGKLFDRAAPGDYINLDATLQLAWGMPAQIAHRNTASPSSDDAMTTLLSGGLK